MKKVTIICVDRWRYTGELMREKYSPLGRLEWIQLQLKEGTVRINSEYIVSIVEYE